MKSLSALVAVVMAASFTSVVLASDVPSAGNATTLPGVSETQSSQGVERTMPASVYQKERSMKTRSNWGGSQNQTTSPASGGTTGSGAGGQTDTGTQHESVPPIPMDQN